MVKLSRDEILKSIKNAGVVGAGGAGFPTHIKMNASVDTVIVNAAECEPLLCKDKELMRLKAYDMLTGVTIAMGVTGAKEGIVGIKKKAKDAIKSLNAELPKFKNIKLFLMDNFYPAGDELILIYEAVKRIVPPGQLPLNVGVVVANTETFINITNAVLKNDPVVDKWISIAGEVKEPITFKVPVGTALKDAVALAGVKNPADYVYLEGGVMMAAVIKDINSPVTKTTSGYVVLPKDHSLLIKKDSSEKRTRFIGKSACDQCTYCTEYCPRYLIGHDVQPHRVMRSLGLTASQKDLQDRWAWMCVECGLCGLFSCPEDLLPNQVCGITKTTMRNNGLKYKTALNELKAHPMREYRKVPQEKILKKCGILKYDKFAHYKDINVNASEYILKLKQHIGAAALPEVKEGEEVYRGQLIASCGDNMGSEIHSSVNGKVSQVTDEWIKINVSR